VITSGSTDEKGWRKSKYSTGNGECVETSYGQGDITVRDSKQPDGPRLRYPEFAWSSFLAATKLGNFDVQS
jgi:hypothetical protein